MIANNFGILRIKDGNLHFKPKPLAMDTFPRVLVLDQDAISSINSNKRNKK